jgi:hypothetical protein
MARNFRFDDGREVVIEQIEPDEAMRMAAEDASRHVRETERDPHVHVDIVFRGRHGSTSAMTAAEVGRVVDVVAEQFRGGRPDPRTEALRWVVDLLEPYPGNVDGYRHQLADIAVFIACTDPEHGASNRAKLGMGDCGLALLEDRGRHTAWFWRGVRCRPRAPRTS